jgi:hypothetical protein
MTEINVPACPVHGTLPRALHSESFEGIVTVIEEIIETVSGVGTLSYSRCPYGYPWNFEGVVRALEDLNVSISGIQGGGAEASGIVGGSGIYISQSGDFQVINATVLSASGLIISAGSGIYLSDAGTKINLLAEGEGGVTVSYSGNVALISGVEPGAPSVIVSGDPGDNFNVGNLWYDTNQGRLFIYASGNGVSAPAWYQTNAEALALKGDLPPSGTGLNAPPRDGAIWYNTLMGSLFVYDATSSGWYETGPSRSVAFGTAAPAPTADGAGWYDESTSSLKIWNGTGWVTT